tara:strand:- start:846 stop:1265 length:420 start_codon:yes stop_codon:yes gene_type:complete
MSRRSKRLILLVLGVPNVVAGAWAILSPVDWYEDFPGWSPRLVSALPPFNEHLVSDSGSGLLAAGLLALMGAWRLRRDVTVVVTLGYLAFALPHAVFHLRHPAADLSTGANLANTTVLWLAVLLVIVVLVAEIRQKKSA